MFIPCLAEYSANTNEVKNRQREEMKNRHARRGLSMTKQKCLSDSLGERQCDVQFHNSIDLAQRFIAPMSSRLTEERTMKTNTPELIPKGQEIHFGIIKLDYNRAQVHNVVVLTVTPSFCEFHA